MTDHLTAFSASQQPTPGEPHETTARHRRIQRWLVALVLMTAVVGHFAVIAHRRAKHGGDFNVNREFGRRLLAGEPLYDDGLCFNYMPIAALYWAPLALVPPSVGIVLRYLVALASLAYVLRTLLRMVSRYHPDLQRHATPVIAITVVLGLHYIVRDLDDGGPNLILLAIYMAGISTAWKGRSLLPAIWFGLAIAVKMTPGLFLPFFLWKRRWRLTAATAIATLVWIVLPAAWMGPANWWRHQQQWNSMATTLVGQADAQRRGNEERVQNQTLILAVKRLLVRYPADHPLAGGMQRSPAVLALAPLAAERVAKLIAIGLLLACCWRSRIRKGSTEQGAAWLCECAGVLLLMLLLSPVTWLQHMVYAIPAIFLLVAHDRTVRHLPLLARIALLAYTFMTLVLNREILGRDNYLLLLSLHMHTFCMLILFTLLLWLRPTVREADEQPADDADPAVSLRTRIRPANEASLGDRRAARQTKPARRAG